MTQKEYDQVVSNRVSFYTLLACIALLAVVLFALNGIHQPATPSSGLTVISQGYSGPAQPTPIHHYGAETGPITATLVSPDNVSLQIVSIQKEATEWLFHVHAHNNGKTSVSIINAAKSHYFVLSLKGTPGKPYTWSELTVQLQPATQAVLGAQAQLATHPALNATVAGGADSDGWLVANLANVTYPPFQLFYVYGTVTAPECPNSTQNPSTCPTGTGYRTLVWNL
jgi:hypothetical protein